mmetsp:Transcript_18138/g.36792  ORF Transcript_18138/g.36792 Transcript_18138/m.36792 type:complete len:146 (+) Transcript_18138:125-562(+)
MCPSTGVGLVLLVCLSVLFQRGACFFAPHPSLQRHVSVGRGRRAAEVSNSLPLLSRDPGYSVLFSTEVDETEKKEGVTVTELGGETKPPAKEKDEEEEEEEDEDALALAAPPPSPPPSKAVLASAFLCRRLDFLPSNVCFRAGTA